MYTYILINIFTILFPLIFSFEKRVYFVKQWGRVLLSSLFVAIFFVSWDYFFTINYVWGFNPRYLLGVSFLHLPLEEILFFFCIPFSCLFIYEIVCYFSKDQIPFSKIKNASFVFIFCFLAIGILNNTRVYTAVTFILLGILLSFHFIIFKSNYLDRFFKAYLLSLLPMMIVNGFLTGGISAIDPGPVVWYNNNQNLGLRVMTIPIEDFFYWMLLFLMNVTVYEFFKGKGLMKKAATSIVFFVVFAFLASGPAYALNWQELHDQADTLDIQQAQSLLTENPQNIESQYLLGLVYLNDYQVEEAKKIFSDILAQEPDSTQAQWGMAEVLRRRHLFDQSTEILKKVIKADSRFAPAKITLAYNKYIQMDFEESVKWSGQVINQGRKNVDQSNYLRAHGLYGAAKGMIAQYGGPISKVVNGTAVLRHLLIIKKIAPDSAVVNFGLGSYYLLIPPILGQDFEKAKEYLEKTIEMDPKFPDPYVRLAQIYRKEGDLNKYEQLLNKALELDPGNEIALDIKTRTCKFICLENIKNE